MWLTGRINHKVVGYTQPLLSSTDTGKLISLLKDDSMRISEEDRETDSILILICTLMHHSKL